MLVSHLQGAKDAVSKVRIVTGLEAICRKHPDQYPSVIKALGQIDATGNDALALAGATFLQNAQEAQATVPDGLIERFTGASPLAKALSTRSRRGLRKQEE